MLMIRYIPFGEQRRVRGLIKTGNNFKIYNMNIHALRLGNLVSYNGIFCSINGINSPTPMKDKRYSDKYIVELFDGSGLISATIDDIHEIQLSEEVLLAAEFKKTGDFVFDYVGDHGKCTENIVFDAPNDWNNTNYYPVGISVSKTIWGYNAECVIIRCLSLHELQNKIFECVGKELKINL